MTIINNKEEFEQFYPYSKDQIDNYPKEYPCMCNWFEEGGGLMGEYRQVYVLYYPKDVDKKSFEQGVRARVEKL